jgi:hypothetical protein
VPIRSRVLAQDFVDREFAIAKVYPKIKLVAFADANCAIVLCASFCIDFLPSADDRDISFLPVS